MESHSSATVAAGSDVSATTVFASQQEELAAALDIRFTRIIASHWCVRESIERESALVRGEPWPQQGVCKLCFDATNHEIDCGCSPICKNAKHKIYAKICRCPVCPIKKPRVCNRCHCDVCMHRSRCTICKTVLYSYGFDLSREKENEEFDALAFHPDHCAMCGFALCGTCEQETLRTLGVQPIAKGESMCIWCKELEVMRKRGKRPRCTRDTCAHFRVKVDLL
jgi:hypothetical protein